MEFINLDTGEPREVEVNKDEVRDRLRNTVNDDEFDTNPVKGLRALIEWLRDL
jgi:hypothetical protein